MSIQSHRQSVKAPEKTDLSTFLFQSVRGGVSPGTRSSAIQLMRERPARRRGSEIG